MLLDCAKDRTRPIHQSRWLWAPKTARGRTSPARSKNAASGEDCISEQIDGHAMSLMRNTCFCIVYRISVKVDKSFDRTTSVHFHQNTIEISKSANLVDMTHRNEDICSLRKRISTRVSIITTCYAPPQGKDQRTLKTQHFPFFSLKGRVYEMITI